MVSFSAIAMKGAFFMKRKKFLSLLLSATMAFTLLTATAFAATPAEEENGFFDFLVSTLKVIIKFKAQS